MTLSPAALAEAQRVAASLAPPTDEEGAVMRLIWTTEPAQDERAA